MKTRENEAVNENGRRAFFKNTALFAAAALVAVYVKRPVAKTPANDKPQKKEKLRERWCIPH